MALLNVRYRTGNSDSFELNEGMNITELGQALNNTSLSDGVVVFGAKSRSGGGAQYAMVSLRMAEVIMWELDGYPEETGVDTSGK